MAAVSHSTTDPHPGEGGRSRRSRRRYDDGRAVGRRFVGYLSDEGADADWAPFVVAPAG